MRNKIKEDDSIPEKFRRKPDLELEKKVVKLLREGADYSGSGFKYKASSGEFGDIDAWAFRDGVLAIAEIKAGLLTDDYLHSAYTEAVKLEGKAAEQLDKAIRFLQSDWDRAKKEMGIQTDCSFEEIEVIPLIITDNFEGDLKLFKSKYYKLSLLELDVIVHNQAKRLYFKFNGVMPINLNFSRSNPSLYNADISNLLDETRNWDLWEGAVKFQLKIIPKCVAENRIWQDLWTQLNLKRGIMEI